MPRRRTLRAVAIGTAAALVLALVAAVAVSTTVVRRPLPEHAGALTVPGLRGEVSVQRDARGVPTIVADDAGDLFMAQGFVHAQDRFFEMDYRRHVTSGRLAELVGDNPDAIAADKVIRTFGWRQVAEEEWDLVAPETREHLQAYADGVNAYLDTHAAGALGVEYTLLGTRVDVDAPEPWDPVDSLAWLKAMAWDLRGNYDDELDRALSYSTLRDADLVDQLFPRYPAGENLPIVTDAATVADPARGQADDLLLDPRLEQALEQVEEAMDAVPHLLGEGDGTGSNSWVVSGDLTESGLPLLANDPHLSISAPGIWSQMGLRCAEVTAACPFDVSGFTFSGFPGVVIGHNADLAWGLTNMGADVTDFFLERVDDDEGTYERDGAQVPLETRTELIEVNGGTPVRMEVRSTVHGPIVSDVLGVDRVAAVPVDGSFRRGSEVALAWTALEPGRTADAVFALNTAADAQDVADAAALFEVPSQNIVFATTSGQIGYQAPGRIPVRSRVTAGPVPSDGTWPRPGWDPRYDWKGFVDPEDLPAVVDPAEGYVVAANQAVTAGNRPFLTADWDYGYRSQRIHKRLEALLASGAPVDAAAMSRIQLDTWSPYADALVPSLLAAPVGDRFTREGVDLLRDWDRRMDRDSPAAAYFAAVWKNLLQLTFRDDLPQDQWPTGDSRWLAVVSGILDDPESPWWDDRRTVNVVETRDEILSRSLSAARLELTVSLGKEADEWHWGRLHQAAPEHPVLGGPSLPGMVRRLVNPGPVAVGGGSSVVDATSWDAAATDGTYRVTSAPSMRMVVDLADLDRSTWVALTGTSGHPGSVHYTDQLDAWAEGRTFPWPWSREAVAEAAVRELTLRPAGELPS